MYNPTGITNRLLDWDVLIHSKSGRIYSQIRDTLFGRYAADAGWWPKDTARDNSLWMILTHEASRYPP